MWLDQDVSCGVPFKSLFRIWGNVGMQQRGISNRIWVSAGSVVQFLIIVKASTCFVCMCCFFTLLKAEYHSYSHPEGKADQEKVLSVIN